MTGLPPHARLRVSDGVRVEDGGDGRSVIVGGSPLRLLRLDARARAVYDALAGETPIGDVRVKGASPRVIGALARRLLDAGIADPIWATASALRAGDVTVVVPVRDRSGPLRRLLHSIAEHTPGIGGVVVVDDCSTDDTADTARALGASVVARMTSGGPAAARNSGAATVTTPVIAFLDSDCTVLPGWLDPLLAHLDDANVAVVAPRIVAPRIVAAEGRDGRSGEARLIARYESARSPLDLGPAPASVRPRTRVAYVPAAALLVRREVFVEVGGFHEAMPVGEDVDFIWRVVAAGHTVRYEPAARVAHEHRDDVRAFLIRRADYGSSAAALTRRHPGLVPPLAVSGWSALAWSGAATQTIAGLAGGIAIAAATTALLPRKLAMLADPWPEAIRLAGRGHWGAGRQLASAIMRTYLPLAIPLALVSTRARRALVAAAVLPALQEWLERRPGIDPLRWTALRVADDGAYCIGVWRGCVEHGTVAPLLPDFSGWPGRRNTGKDVRS